MIFFLSENFRSKYKMWGYKSPILEEFMGNIEILSGNLQLSVGKLQLSAPPTFSTHERSR